MPVAFQGVTWKTRHYIISKQPSLFLLPPLYLNGLHNNSALCLYYNHYTTLFLYSIDIWWYQLPKCITSIWDVEHYSTTLNDIWVLKIVYCGAITSYFDDGGVEVVPTSESSRLTVALFCTFQREDGKDQSIVIYISDQAQLDRCRAKAGRKYY